MDETTLSRLCLIFFKHNLPSILDYHQRQGLETESLFQLLPPNICENFMKIASTILNPRLLLYLFKTGIKDIYLQYYNQDIPFKQFSNISEGITCMVLNSVTLSENIIQKVISHSPNIVVLKLCQTNTKDSTLEIIGSTCSFIECLDLSFCEITDKGLRALCQNYKDEDKIRCRHLKVLRVNNTLITAKGLTYILEHIPILKLYAENNIYLRTIHFFIRRNFGKTLYIKNLNLKPIEEKVDVLEILTSIPNAESLCLYKISVTNMDLISLPRFEHLRRLSISANKEDKTLTFEDGIAFLLRVSGQQLEELRLNNFQYVNVYLIGKYCHKLRGLELYSIRHLYFRMDLYDEIMPVLNSLDYLKLKNLYGKPWDDCLSSIFRNCPNLIELNVISTLCLTDAVLLKIIPLLKNVNYIIICYCSNITKFSIYSILDRIPHLRSLWISSKQNILNKIEENQIKEYIMRKGIICDFFYHRNNSNDNQSADLREVRFYF